MSQSMTRKPKLDKRQRLLWSTNMHQRTFYCVNSSLQKKKQQTNTQLNTNTKSVGSRKLWKYWWFILIFLEKRKYQTNKYPLSFVIARFVYGIVRSFCRIWYFIQWFYLYFLKITVNKIFLDEHKTVFIATDNSLCSFFLFLFQTSFAYFNSFNSLTYRQRIAFKWNSHNNWRLFS